MRGMRDARQHIAPAVGYGCAYQGVLPGLAVVRAHLIQRGRDSVGPLVHGLGVGEGDNGTTHPRLGTLEMKCSGQDITLTYSVGWIDYKLGEVPSDLFKRAGDVLQLYKKASKDNFSTTLIVR